MNLGDQIDEASRAEAADENDAGSFRVLVRTTDEGTVFLQSDGAKERQFIGCIISENITEGVTKWISKSPSIVHVSETTIESIHEHTNDFEEQEGEKHRVALNTYVCGKVLVFVAKDIPGFVLQDAFKSSVENLLHMIKMAYIFSYETLAEFRTSSECEKRTFIVPNSYCDSSNYVSHQVALLPMPNVLGKVAGEALTILERNQVPGLVVVHYLELSDMSWQLLPFKNFIESSPELTKLFQGGPELFRATKVINTILSSNLFV